MDGVARFAVGIYAAPMRVPHTSERVQDLAACSHNKLQQAMLPGRIKQAISRLSGIRL